MVMQHRQSGLDDARRHSSMVSHATNHVTWNTKVNRMPMVA
jgi:hypothetical protein